MLWILFRSSQWRIRNPTTDSISERIGRKRIRETYEAAQKIHGGSKENREPGETGLVDTVIKRCRTSFVAEEVIKLRKIMKAVSKKFKKKTKSYERSEDNFIYFIFSVQIQRNNICIASVNSKLTLCLYPLNISEPFLHVYLFIGNK